MRAGRITRLYDAPDGSLSLSYEARYRRRGLLTTDAGEENLMDLAEAAELGDGDALVLEDGRRIAIRAAAEPLAEIRADGPALARLAWHVGNRHTPCQVGAGRLLIGRDRVLEDMLRGLGTTVTHVEEPFAPERGAYSHGAQGHGHAGDPHGDPKPECEHPAPAPLGVQARPARRQPDRRAPTRARPARAALTGTSSAAPRCGSWRPGCRPPTRSEPSPIRTGWNRRSLPAT